MHGDWNGRTVDQESTDGEEGENDFADHDDRVCRKGEQMTTAPGLRLERLEKGAWESCTAAGGNQGAHIGPFIHF